MSAPLTAPRPSPSGSPSPAPPPPDVEARHVAHVLDEVIAGRGDSPALRHLVAGEWRDVTWRELKEAVGALASALVDAGIGEGDRVAILASNQPAWTIADLAILRVRGVSVPIHSTSSDAQIGFILRDSGSRMVFAGAGEPSVKVATVLPGCPGVERVVVFGNEALPEGERFERFDDMLRRGREAGRGEEVAERLSRARPDDLLTLLYTSGTTGEPKGVMLPHSAFTVTCTYHDLRLPPIGADDVSLCFLPLSHIFERAWTFYILYRGAVTAYCEDPKDVGLLLPQVRPTLMCAVPRFYEKVFAKVHEKVAASSVVRRALFAWAVRTGGAVSLKRRNGLPVPRLLALRHAVADRLVLSKIRAGFGGRTRLLPCAGAPLSPAIEEFFHSVGVFVCQGYGLTETTATVTCHDPAHFRVGTVGSPLPGIEVRISEEGEVLVKARTVMQGYWNRPVETAAVFRDGWFRTGDAGEIGEDGTLRITDRIKDLIKTAGGKYVAPQQIETTIGADPLVEQVAVLGEGRSFVTALVVPAFDALEKWAREAGIAFTGREDLVRNAKVLDLIRRTIEERTKDLAPWEKVRKFALLAKEFSVEGGSMTPTLKVRRRAAAELHRDRIEEMYEGEVRAGAGPLSYTRPPVRGATVPLLLLLLLPAVLSTPAPAVEGVPPVSPGELGAHIRFLADDLLEGRAPGTRGDRLTQAYLEAAFRGNGLAPAFGASYRQDVPIRLVTPDPRTTLDFSGAVGGESAGRFGDDFVLGFPKPEAAGRVSADLVFAGYGIEAKEWGWDDFKGVDVAGKVLLLLAGEPGGDDPALFAGKTLTHHGRWRTKLEVAARHRAAGVLFVYTREGAGYGWEVVRNGWTRPVTYDPAEARLLLEGWLSGPAAVRAIRAAGESPEELRTAANRPDFRPRPLAVKVEARANPKYETIVSGNVAGLVRGKGPADSSPVVVVSAHHDHLGVGTTENGDSIYNGAMDNGSALAVLLALSRRIGARTGALPVDVLFLAPAAEEGGLLGSGRFVAQPPVPLPRMVANINLEMSAVWGPARDLVAIGAGESALGSIVEAVAKKEGLKVAPEPAPEQGFFYRSDQYSFARAGIPGIWIDLGDDLVGTPAGTGLARREEYRAKRYHRPKDEFDPAWELTGTAQLARVVELAIEEIAARGGVVPWKSGSPYRR